MRAKNLKRVLSVALVGAMLLSLSACGSKNAVEPMEKEEVASVSFNFLGGKDVMPISGFYGPYPSANSSNGNSVPDFYTDETFSDLSDAGINMIHYSITDYATAPEQAIKMLELGEKHNVGICVYDTEICQPAPGVDIDLNLMDERITNYCDYPAFCGVYVVDEPGTPYFKPSANQSHDISTFVTVFQNLKKLGIFGAGNLFPVWSETDHEKYNQMIEEYCETCEPMYLSFDYYLWDGELTKSGYFYNVDVIRHYAEEYNIPFWVYIQAGGQWADGQQAFDSNELYPSEGQLHWNVNSALAYGAKGIEYFPLIQPYYFAFAESTEFDFQRNGILGAWGNKTQWYYYAQSVNAQIAAVDSVLMNSVNKGVLATGAALEDMKGREFLMEGNSWREVESIEGDTLTGCFNYNGKTALYVVNYSEKYAQKVTLNLKDSYNLSVTQSAETTTVNTDELLLDLKAGEGALVVFD